MLVNILLDRLKGQGYQFSYMGPEAAEIYAVQMLPDVSWEKDSEIIYVACYDVFEEISFTDSLTKIPCILVSGGHEYLEHILQAVQGVLVDDIRRRDHLVKLQKDISEGRGIYDLVIHCSKIMGNQVLFINHALNIVCQYPETGTGQGENVRVADDVEQWRNTQGEACQNRERHCQIRHVFYRNEGYYIYVMETHARFDDIRNPEYLQRICSMFDTGRQKKRSDEKTQINEILTGLLQKKFEFPEKEKKKLEHLGWKNHEKYTVLVVENKEMSEADAVSRDLGSMLHTDIYSPGAYFAAILYSEKYVEYTEQDFPELRRYLEDRRLIGILSMGFFDIEYCAVRFEQSKSCFDFVMRENKPGLRYYGRYQMSHFITVLNKNHQIDLRNFCSPIILQIYEIDKKQKTDYLSTLFTYICSGQAMKYSADAMHIHVNTMYMRVSKLKDEFKIDFDDAHMLYTLHNSIVFLHQYDSSCLNEPYPCLQ